MKSSIVLTAIVAIALAGCVSSTTPVPPCCYLGAVTTARLGSLDVRTEDGKRMTLTDALPGFTPDERLFTATLPFEQAESQDIIYASLEPLYVIYDATPIWALSVPNADVGGLMNWIHARRGSMNETGRIIFEDLERLGIDIRTRGSENDDDVEDWSP